jgi:hypothetical protein
VNAGTYVERAPIRRLGAIAYVACRDAETGAPRLLVEAGAPGAETLLAEIARVHALIDDPRVPRVVHVEDTFVALDCDAVSDLAAAVPPAVSAGYRAAWRAVTAFVVRYLETLDAAHRAIDPKTGAPVCLGACAGANVLLSPRGKIWIMGWGHPWQSAERARIGLEVPDTFFAQEAHFGVLKVGSDLAAAVRMFHAFLQYGQMPSGVPESILGAGPDATLAGLVMELMGNSNAPRPEDRDIPRYLATFDQVVKRLDIVPDDEVFARDIAQVCELHARAGKRLVVARDGAWFESPQGELVEMGRKATLRRLLLALAQARIETPGKPLSPDTLVATGWPGEKTRADAAKNRLYVAIASLRTLGLRDDLQSDGTGYRLDPHLTVQWSDTPARR